MLLLLVENYTQYPAISTWNIVVLGNFWKLLQEQSKFEFRCPTDQKLSIVKIETFQAPVKGPCVNLADFMYENGCCEMDSTLVVHYFRLG